jgi:hypothetical protein
MILSKRFQQAVFGAVASSNRFSPSGAPSGLSLGVMNLDANANDINPDTITSTSYVVVPGVTATFPTPRLMSYLFLVSTIGKTSGATGQYAYGNIHVDGTTIQRSGWLWDKGVVGYTGGLLSSSRH